MANKSPFDKYVRPATNLFSHNGTKPRANYMLTAKGKMKAEEVSIPGPKGEVVMVLDSSESPSTISEISNATRISIERVKRIMEVLIRDGWAMKTTAE